MRLVALVVALVVQTACSHHKGNGVSDSKSVSLEEVVDVENTTEIDLHAASGATEESAEVTCDENLLEYILLDEFEGSLTVRLADNVSIDPKVACHVDVAVATLEALRNSGSGAVDGSGDLTGFEEARVSGSGALDVEGIAGTNVGLRNSGSGELTVSGTADRLDLDSSGSGAITAQGLTAIDAVIRSSGSGGVTVTVTRDLEVYLTGSGDVDVYGHPAGTVSLDDTGSGTVNLL